MGRTDGGPVTSASSTLSVPSGFRHSDILQLHLQTYPLLLDCLVKVMPYSTRVIDDLGGSVEGYYEL